MKKLDNPALRLRIVKRGGPKAQETALQAFFPGTGVPIKTGEASGYKSPSAPKV